MNMIFTIFFFLYEFNLGGIEEFFFDPIKRFKRVKILGNKVVLMFLHSIKQ